MKRAELWGAIECGITRVHDEVSDPVKLTGHEDRLSDLDRIASLGIHTLRYPVSWNRVAPRGIEHADWRWTDERLYRLRELGITPIVALCHQGGVPRHLSVLDPSFCEGLPELARAVADRYPWLTHYTPVHAPLLTARLSALEGRWYPHATGEAAFLRALLNQLNATVRAMKQIRMVNPRAVLVQTEDIGVTWATPRLQYQADHENELRWLTFDLLSGRGTASAAVRDYFARGAISSAQLDYFAENACMPDLLALGYRLDDERLLDERVERHPGAAQAGNGRHTWVSVEAQHSAAEGVLGHLGLARAAWARYHRPLAFTGAHRGGPREEQLRWLHEAWCAVGQARREGIDARGLEAGALFGRFDAGRYQPGAFDVRGPEPRETAVAKAIRGWTGGAPKHHPVMFAPGAWRRETRFTLPAVRTLTASDARLQPRLVQSHARGRRPLLIAGAGGTLGRAVQFVAARRGLRVVLTRRVHLDVAEPESVVRALDTHRPWAVVNAAGYRDVDGAERDVSRCVRENVTGPSVLAAACARLGIQLLTFSSDLVFDGVSGRPYLESDVPAPLSVYGRSKAEAEARVLEVNPDALVVRTSAFFSPWDEHDFVARTLAALKEGRPVPAPCDLVVSPTYVPDLVDAALDLLIDRAHGIWHLVNGGALTWEQLARDVARRAGLPQRLICAVSGVKPGCAPRPRYSVLASEHGLLMPRLETALEEYFEAAPDAHEAIAAA